MNLLLRIAPLCVFCSALAAAAQPLPEGEDDLSLVNTRAEGGLICSGFDPQRKRWGQIGVGRGVQDEQNCPDNHAFTALLRTLGIEGPAKRLDVIGTCCPLPEGVLREEHVYHSEECPENYVATGVRRIRETKDCSEANNCIPPQELQIVQLRCSKIDTERYQLGDPNPFYIWGWQPHFSTLLHRRTTKSRMPVSLRYGVGRSEERVWSREGCVAYPWGSLLTKKSSKYCEGYFSRELQYRGRGEDPPAGTPVRYLARCSALSDPLDPAPRCIPSRR